ncbi:MAG: restriction endonuclease subunit S [Gallionella sp.]|jgi:type I restriction enzyme S subunit
MSFPHYSEYKDSGVQWLGEVPEHWHNVRVKNIFAIGRGRVISLDEANENGTYPVFSSQTTNDGCLGFIETFDFDCDQITWTTDGANAGTVFLRKGKHNCTNVCGTLQLKSAVDYNLNFGLHYLSFATQFYKRPDTNGAKIMNGEMAEIAMVVPPTEEQTQIAAFLDHETAKIDELVAEQRRLMELLKEKRQAVISHAVTQGINPNAPMKDSGIEWLGDIPAHWVIGKFSRLVSTRKGIAFKADHFTDDGVNVVKASDIKGLTIKQSETCLPNSFLEQYPQAILRTGELVLSTVGSAPEVRNSAVGQIGKVPEALSESLLNQNTVVFTPLALRLTNDFLFFILQTVGYRDHLDLYAHGTANQASINVSDMLDFFVPLPNPDEQIKITRFISEEFTKFDTLTAEAQRAIDLLQERRTALISAAVTGQIDVRQFTEE